MRVCVVSPYRLGEVSGITSLLLDLAREYALEGHPTTILTPSGGADLRLDGVSIVEVATIEPFADVSLALGTVASLWRFRSRWDIVHANQPHLQTVLAGIVARILGRPQVTTFHLRPPRPRGVRGLLARVWTRLSLAVSTERVFVSSSTQTTFGTSGRIIYNGVRIAEIRAALADRDTIRRELGLDGVVVGFIGRRTQGKGYLDLLEAIRLARDHGVDVRLLTIGSAIAEEAPSLAKRTDELGLSRWIVDLGERPDRLRYLTAIDIFALPSYIEGMPMSLLEVMAIGLPIVATRVGGVPEVLEDGVHAFLVGPGDINHLSARIERLAKDPALRVAMAAKAFDRIASFSVRKTVADYVTIYESLLARMRGSS